MGILTPEVMRKYRKHAIVLIFILAALFTPPDPFTQIMLGIPLILLYELSIFISLTVNKGREKREEKNIEDPIS
jgi:sec-independent protein translocase protein TatC